MAIPPAIVVFAGLAIAGHLVSSKQQHDASTNEKLSFAPLSTDAADIVRDDVYSSTFGPEVVDPLLQAAADRTAGPGATQPSYLSAVTNDPLGLDPNAPPGMGPADARDGSTNRDGPMFVPRHHALNDHSSEAFRHNNMTPFFSGASTNQNMDPLAGAGILERYTGAGSNAGRSKREVEGFAASGTASSLTTGILDPDATKPGGGVANQAYQLQYQRLEGTSRARKNELPFQQQQVARADGLRIGDVESDARLWAAGRNVDELRTANNPKMTYETPAPTQGLMERRLADLPPDAMEAGKPRRGERLVDNDPSRWLASHADVTKAGPRMTAEQLMRGRDPTQRVGAEERMGPMGGIGAAMADGTDPLEPQRDAAQQAASRHAQDIDRRRPGLEGYVPGAPADVVRRTTKPSPWQEAEAKVDAASFGRRLPEPVIEQLAPAERGGLGFANLVRIFVKPFTDWARPTRSEWTVEAQRAAGNPTGPPVGVVYDPDQVTRQTIRQSVQAQRNMLEGDINLRSGQHAGGSRVPTALVARTTIRSYDSGGDRFGAAGSSTSAHAHASYASGVAGPMQARGTQRIVTDSRSGDALLWGRGAQASVTDGAYEIAAAVSAADGVRHTQRRTATARDYAGAASAAGIVHSQTSSEAARASRTHAGREPTLVRRKPVGGAPAIGVGAGTFTTVATRGAILPIEGGRFGNPAAPELAGNVEGAAATTRGRMPMASDALLQRADADMMLSALRDNPFVLPSLGVV
jgi:hypothetical protein